MGMLRLELRLVSITAVLATLAASSVAGAQSWRVHATGAGAHAVSGHQKEELGYGAVGLGAIEYGLTPKVGVGLEVGWLWLGESDAPDDPSLQPLDAASAVSGAFALRVRPFAKSQVETGLGAGGVWLGGGLGAANTDGSTRLFFDAHLGYDFLLSEGAWGVGPTVGLLHVSQPDDQVRPADANVLSVGVHAMFDFASPPKRKVDPPTDRDGDGIYDAMDSCPDDPEDLDGYEDQDGCPDQDNDQDGVLDRLDDCPMEPEDGDGFEDEDGCPENDNDQDGILDTADKCPDEPEDLDGFEDEDGCPDPDNDQDSILDAKDLCPDEPETMNNYADHDGCPDEEQVRVVGDKIVLDDRVHFYTNSHKIRAVSYPLLQRLSKLVAEHPEYTHIGIEGHADQRGPEHYNKQLSQKRAEAVLEFMVQHGVDRGRLSAKGFGSERPLVEAKSEHAYLLNRRVEFVVTRKLKQVVPSENQPSESQMGADSAMEVDSVGGDADAQEAEPDGADVKDGAGPSADEEGLR